MLFYFMELKILKILKYWNLLRFKSLKFSVFVEENNSFLILFSVGEFVID